MRLHLHTCYPYTPALHLDLHPGGKRWLFKNAGGDATEEFKLFHNESVLRKFGPKMRVGALADFAPAPRIEMPGSFGDMVGRSLSFTLAPCPHHPGQ